MNLESSRMTVSLTAFGNVRCSVSSLARTPSMTATVFSPIARRTSTTTAGASPIQAAERAQQQLPLALLDRTAGNLDVFRHQRVAHLAQRQAVGVQLLNVDHDV